MAALVPLMHNMDAGSDAKIQDPEGGCFKNCCDYSEPIKQRDAFWDNYKGLSQFFVLSMHLGSMGMFLCSDTFLDSIAGRVQLGYISFIFMFTMPSYCFITGFLSSENMHHGQRVNLVRFAVTWLIQHGLTVVLALQQTMMMKRSAWVAEHPDLNATNAKLADDGKSLLSPPGLLPVQVFQTVGLDWYLWCVIIWRCFLPLIAQLRRPLATSLILSVCMMFTDSSTSTYSNAPFGFLPFFVLGFLAKQRQQELVALRENKLLRIGFVLTAIVTVSLPLFDTSLQSYLVISRNLGCIYGGDLANQMNFDFSKANITEMITNPQPYSVTHYCQSGSGAIQVIAFYGASMSLILGCMTLVPTKQIALLTRAGANSIYIYFGQIYPMMFCFVAAAGLSKGGLEVTPLVAVVAAYACVAAIWVLLSQPCFKCVCGPCIEPKVERACLRAASA